MAITTMDGLVSAVAASRRQKFFKIGPTPAIGSYNSLWFSNGAPGTAAAGPAVGTGVALDRTAQGALPVPAPSAISYLGAFDAAVSQPGTLILCDRIAQWGVNAAVNTAQSMGAVTLPARATGLTDIELWFDVETALGATQSGNITINYTDQDNAAGTTVLGQFPASAGIGRSLPVSLAAGDYGVRSLTSVTLAVATTGKYLAVLRRQLCSIVIPQAGLSNNLGWPETDLEQIGDNACLELVWLAGTSTAPTIGGGYSIPQG